nr:hypothetical protein [Salinibacterium sp.]
MLFDLDRGQTFDRGVQVVFNDPMDPVQRQKLQLVDGLERAIDSGAFVLAEPYGGLGHRFDVAITDGADRGQSANDSESIDIANCSVLTA